MYNLMKDKRDEESDFFYFIGFDKIFCFGVVFYGRRNRTGYQVDSGNLELSIAIDWKLFGSRMELKKTISKIRAEK